MRSTKQILGQTVTEAVAKGPGGRYRLACTDLGLVLMELPAKGRTASGFRERLRSVLGKARNVDGDRRTSTEDHRDWFVERVEEWDGELAWEMFWHPPALDLRGSPFRRKVWDALRKLPPGEVLTYRELAERSGSPRAARAVGTSMHENPAPLFVPCHRVVSAQGIGGFGNAGLTLKRKLLAFEDAVFDQASRETAVRASE